MTNFKIGINEAIENLKKDKNNSVAYFFLEKNEKNGPLTGYFFSIKSNFATREGPSHGSSISLLNFHPGYNSTVFEKLLNAGAQPLVKVHNDELGLGGKGLFSAFGKISNPIDPKKLVGGSSSGSAATISSVSFAIGSDTGDSIRRPASFVGKVGFKPSYGAVSRYGLFAYATSLDTVAWMTHNVSDAILVAQAVFAADENDLTSVDVKIEFVKKEKPKKIAILDFDFEIEPYVAKKVHEIRDILQADGVQVDTVLPNLEIFKAILPVYEIISYSEATSNLSAINGITFGKTDKNLDWEKIFLKTRTDGFGFMLQKRLIWGSFFLEKENQDYFFVKAKKMRTLIKEYYESLLQKYDLVIFPAFYGIAPDISGENTEKSDKITNSILAISNLVGNPSISIPMGKYENMPFNLALDSVINSDEKLLGFALYIEEKIGKNDGKS
ncbi:amidase family protein [Mycoplasma sp. 'Moose RK']|uniref:amidase family protein n=1 Tax=Mycoplasma sp. 'Moose RK' TaxID=2780095 RepID=UPI0018C295BC|nr:amidase family protein [Mycoplasma sp. 'Moose RK']MBG0730503.1 Asp-tRNA(Asn)/Glu-tRNA(Gln) amidotransferase subunit GatA [Mycoplasma sp. 'Moose RK']